MRKDGVGSEIQGETKISHKKVKTKKNRIWRIFVEVAKV
jgi:hypothetical protein